MRYVDADKLYPDCMTKNGTLAISQSQIANAPTVKPRIEYGTDGQPYILSITNGIEERPQGEWIKIFENPFTNGYICPFCGHKIQVTEQFLPKVTECEGCGAEMKGGAE